VFSELLQLKLVDSGRPYYGPSKRPRRLARPRTPPFHGDNTGSNPVGDANHINSLEAGAGSTSTDGDAVVTN
jgi:hypothetical protein